MPLAPLKIAMVLAPLEIAMVLGFILRIIYSFCRQIMNELVETEEEYVKKLAHVCEVKFGCTLLILTTHQNIPVYHHHQQVTYLD